MDINSVEFTDESKEYIRITGEDGGVTSLPWPVRTWHAEIIRGWLDAGNEIAEPPAPEPVVNEDFTFKTDIWMRCTDDEAERLDGVLQTTNVRQRRMWDDCQTVEHKSDLFNLLTEQMTATFGAERTVLLLAPSNEV